MKILLFRRTKCTSVWAFHIACQCEPDAWGPSDAVLVLSLFISLFNVINYYFQTINYIEKKFVEKHTQTIRDLAGHTNDLINLIKGAADPSLSIYLFDEYLKTIY